MDDALLPRNRRAARRCGCRRRRSDSGGSAGGGAGGGSGRASAASRLPPPPGRLECRPLQISVVQSAGPAGGVAQRAHGRHHRRADRLEAELVLAPPAHPDRRARPLHGDDRGVGRRIVGAVMAVAARPLRVLDRDRGDIELQGAGQRRAQRIDALAMRPHGQVPVLEHGHRARRRDRGVGDVHAGKGRLAPARRPASARRARARRAPGRSRAAGSASAPLPAAG